MTEKEKRFYWLKLKEDFFQDEVIEWLEEQANGKDYVLFYLKLCLKSLKNNGVLIRQVGNMLVPYNVEKLAEMTKTSVDTVAVALKIFQEIGLIEIEDSGGLYLTQLRAMVGSESASPSAVKKRAYREKLKLEDKKGDTMGTICPTEYRDKSIEIRDKNIEKEIYKEKEKADKSAPPYEEIINSFNSTCSMLPQVRLLTKARKTAIKLRWLEYKGDLNVFHALFTAVRRSKFLTGENNRQWQCNFDWLMKSANFAKVLEGTYSDKQKTLAEQAEELQRELDMEGGGDIWQLT